MILWFGAALCTVSLVAGGVMWALRRQRNCPSCRVALVPLGKGPENVSHSVDGELLTYEVLVCPRCTNALTNVHGARSRYAFCPECRQRTLETPCIRLPDTADGRRRVEVHENCHLCDHGAVREVADPSNTPARRGQVLQFPQHRRRRTANDE